MLSDHSCRSYYGNLMAVTQLYQKPIRLKTLKKDLCLLEISGVPSIEANHATAMGPIVGRNSYYCVQRKKSYCLEPALGGAHCIEMFTAPIESNSNSIHPYALSSPIWGLF